jgi:polysaccharide biosynthesis protein PslH
MEPRPELLFLAQSLPYPPHSGVTNRTFNVLKQLAKEFSVTLLAFSRKNHQATPADVQAAVDNLARQVDRVLPPAPIQADHSRFHKIRVHLQSVLHHKPYTWYEYASGDFAAELDRFLAEARPRMVHLDSLDLMQWLDRVERFPRAVTHHSIESELLRLRANHIGSSPARAYLRFQADQVERSERDLCPRVDLNVMMSQLDAQRLVELAPGSRTMVCPNGVDTHAFVPSGEPVLEERVAFLGPSYMFPNRDALVYFLELAWPRVIDRMPSATLHLIGKTPPEDRALFERSPNVVVQGYVPDIRPHLAAAACCIAPLRIGGGTRLKILDYWSLGKAVVSTTIGAEGLLTDDGSNILLRDDPEGLAEAVVDVLHNRELRTRLELEGRRTAEEHYSWDVIGDRLRRAYFSLLS